MIKKFPAYLYRGTLQIDRYDFTLYMDDAICQNYSQYTAETTLYHWQNVQITNAKKTITEYLGFDAISNNTYHLYRGDAPLMAIPDALYNVRSLMNVKISDQPTVNASGNWTVKTLNNCVTRTDSQENTVVIGDYNGSNNIANRFTAYTPRIGSTYIDDRYNQAGFGFYVFPEDMFDADTGVIQLNKYCVVFSVDCIYHSGGDYISEMALKVQYKQTSYNHFAVCFDPRLNLNNSQSTDEDPDNENGNYNDPNTGGDGDFGDPDSKDPTPVPDLPSLGASDFVKIYTPSASVLTSLAQFLWSADTVFNIDNFKKVYNDPSECIVGLSIVPCLPASAGSKHIMFGNIDTEVSCSYVNTQWVKVDCGWKYIETLVKNFTDYSPYTKLQIFLPYIGFQHINIDEVAGKSIHVVYHVDIISGDLICFIETYADGVIYSFSGNCLATVPVTGSSYGNFLGKYYSQLAQAPSAMISGAMQGGAAGAALGGLNTLFNAAQTALLDRKALFTHSGSMSGAASIMGVQRPFVIIERPNISVPDYVQNYAGRSSNKTVSLGNCSGFTQVDYVHIDNVPATSEEIKEIETLLHEGVIL